VTGALDRRPIRFFRVHDEPEGSFYAVQGIDVRQKKGICRLALRVERKDGVWVLQAHPFLIRRRRYFSPFGRRRAIKVRRKKKRIKSRRRSSFSRSRFWRRWLRKKKYILAENRPYKEWKRLQGIYRVSEGKHFWRNRFGFPINKYLRISSLFGEVRYLTSGGGSPHRGVDYAASTGSPVLATARGRVVYSGKTIVRGGLVILNHGYGVFSTYMHMSRVIARSNTIVYRGQLIGRVGTTGLSTGPHLHFGVRAGNVQVDPAEWMRRSIFPVRRWNPLPYSDDPDDFYRR